MAVALPVISADSGLTRYLAEIRRFPMLAVEEEYMLAKRWRDHQDRDAAQKLVTSHLRLVAKIAMGYRGYGLPIGEVISEGNIGLMQAVKRFEPEKGFRLATYAMWWIKASIQEYILRSWSLVKMGTTAAQKKLFFNLRRMKSKLDAFEDGDLRPEHITDEVQTKARQLNDLARERGQSLAQMALAWVLREPIVSTALVGFRRPEEVDENLGALRVAFTGADLDEIDTLASTLRLFSREAFNLFGFRDADHGADQRTGDRHRQRDAQGEDQARHHVAPLRQHPWPSPARP